VVLIKGSGNFGVYRRTPDAALPGTQTAIADAMRFSNLLQQRLFMFEIFRTTVKENLGSKPTIARAREKCKKPQKYLCAYFDSTVPGKWLYISNRDLRST
jgi:hypothetical protein